MGTLIKQWPQRANKWALPPSERLLFLFCLGFLYMVFDRWGPTGARVVWQITRESWLQGVSGSYQTESTEKHHRKIPPQRGLRLPSHTVQKRSAVTISNQVINFKRTKWNQLCWKVHYFVLLTTASAGHKDTHNTAWECMPMTMYSTAEKDGQPKWLCQRECRAPGPGTIGLHNAVSNHYQASPWPEAR